MSRLLAAPMPNFHVPLVALATILPVLVAESVLLSQCRLGLNGTLQIWSDTNPAGRWRKFNYDEIIVRDKASLDFLAEGQSLSDLPNPHKLAEDIITNLQSALANFQEIANGLDE